MSFHPQAGTQGFKKSGNIAITPEKREAYWQAMPFALREAIRNFPTDQGIASAYKFYRSQGLEATLQKLEEKAAYHIAANALRLYGPDHPQANEALVLAYEASHFTQKPTPKASKAKRKPTDAELADILNNISP